ncbi:DNA-directed RNA polymerase sigma-70 factor [Dyadobacter beijingensis]|uniref:DNA-directed RNA polymerase sigma-70 factor n=1 Tax=Dyadobacter beijingensis TaxID=365489 RepID=A0ABQ2HPI4_9BACT|nr:sigma-70 family RNA polymerase sigma factor [Dyadobacter beijingensis]GGM87086.1 DNA-directed RNA polymerase sigma-70 factor [Dyadobacter beijingensis]
MVKPHPVVRKLENIPQAHVKFLKLFHLKGNEPVPEAEKLAAYRRSGDVSALGVLYAPYMDMVFGVCFQYLRDEEDSKDAVMQIFEKLIVDLKQHEVSNLKSWLHSVARNHCLMKLRSARSVAGFEHLEDADHELYAALDRDDSPLHLEGRLDALDDCMQKLTREQRMSIELFYMQEKCYRDIAGETGFDMGKVKSYIQNGKRNLKICIESHGSY